MVCCLDMRQAHPQTIGDFEILAFKTQGGEMTRVSPTAQDRFVAKLMRTKQRTKTRKRKRTNYARGAEVERRIVNAARTRGCIAARTAGSHSPLDVFIIDNENETITFVQCKRSKTKRFPKVTAPFREGYYLVSFRQVNHQDGRGIVDESEPDAP